MHRFAQTLVVWLGLGLLFCGATRPRSAAAENGPPAFQGIPASTWIDRLKDKDVAVRREAATALAKSSGKKAEPTQAVAKLLMPVLFDMLKDADAGVRRQAALAWVRCNGVYGLAREAEARVLLPVLLDAAEDADATTRYLAASSLVRVNRDEKAVLGPLTRLLKDPDETVRNRAASALREVEPRGAAVPALVGALDDKSDGVRSAAVISLAWIGEPAR